MKKTELENFIFDIGLGFRNIEINKPKEWWDEQLEQIKAHAEQKGKDEITEKILHIFKVYGITLDCLTYREVKAELEKLKDGNAGR